MPYALEGEREGAGKSVRAGLVTLQKVISHALCGLGADAGEATQRSDQLLQGRWRFHQTMMNDE